MAATAGFTLTDWSIDRDVTPSLISYIGDDHLGTLPSYATVLEFHRGISVLADDATSVGDDEHDITDPDATDKSTDNIITLNAGYDLSAGSIEHLYDGSIIFDEDDKIWDGIVNFGNVVKIQVHQDGAVITDDWWNNDSFGVDGLGNNSDAAAGISHRFMIETVATGGTDVDGRRLIGTSRTLDDTNQRTFPEFSINGTSRGNNVLALSDAADIFNTNTATDIAGWVITNTEGWQELDIDGTGSSGQAFYSQWDDSVTTGTGRALTVNDIYEYIKWATRDGTSETLYGLNGELFRGITHQVALSGNSGTYQAFEAVTWTGGTGQMFAIDSTTAPTLAWVQILTGVAPTGSFASAGAGSGASTVGTVTTRTVSFPFLGTSTGSNILGAYGVGFLPASVGSSDTATDLAAAVRTPPNNITFTLANLDATGGQEDRLLITNNNAGDIDYAQLGVNATQTTDIGAGVLVSDTVIPTDTPTAGYIRVLDDNGRYRRISYSSYTGSTFTIDEGLAGEADFSTTNATAGNNMFIAYMDRIAASTSEAFSGVNLNRTLFIRVRNAGTTPIKPFTATSAVSADATLNAGRISDA